MAIMADHHIPYAATATIAYPEDFFRKMKKARADPGNAVYPSPLSLPSGLENSF